MARQPRRWLSAGRWQLVIAAGPALIPLWLIHRYGVDVPFWDQWDVEGQLLLDFHRHSLTLTQLLAQHNEHRIFIPRLALLAIAILTKFNTLAEMRLEWLLVCGTSLGLYLLHRQTTSSDQYANERQDDQPHDGDRPVSASLDDAPSRSSRHRNGALAWLFCNLLLFHPRQSQNWLWGLGVANVMPMFWIVAALLVANSRTSLVPKIAAAIGLSVAATYSSGNGALAWPLVGFVLLGTLRGRPWTTKIVVALAWVIATSLVAAAYLHNYARPLLPSGATGHAPIGQMAHFGLILLGMPLAWDTPLIWEIDQAFDFGLFLTGAFAATIVYFLFAGWVRRDECLFRRLRVWLAVGGFAVGSAILGAWFRGGFGADHATASRYITFSLYLPVALVQVAAIVSENVGRRWAGGATQSHAANCSSAREQLQWLAFQSLAIANLGLILLLSFPESLLDARRSRDYRAQAKAAVLLIDRLPNNPVIASEVYPDPARVKGMIDALRSMDAMELPTINFSDADASRDVGVPESDFLGELESSTIFAGSINIRGWAISRSRAAPASAVFLTCQDRADHPMVIVQARSGWQRTPIALRLGNPNYGPCGWSAHFSRAAIPIDARSAIIRAWALDLETGKAHQLSGEWVLNR